MRLLWQCQVLVGTLIKLNVFVLPRWTDCRQIAWHNLPFQIYDIVELFRFVAEQSHTPKLSKAGRLNSLLVSRPLLFLRKPLSLFSWNFICVLSWHTLRVKFGLKSGELMNGNSCAFFRISVAKYALRPKSVRRETFWRGSRRVFNMQCPFVSSYGFR